MAKTTKTSITRKAALDIVLKAFQDEGAVEALEGMGALQPGDAADVVEVVKRIREQMDKPADGRMTKAQIENEPIIREVLAFLQEKAGEGEPDEEDPERGMANSVMVRDGIPAILTAQKAVKVLGELVKRGQAERVMVGSRVWFRAL